AATRMAAGLHAKWIAVYVQTSQHLSLPEAEQNRVVETLRLAERLGAETVTLMGDNVSEQLLSYARERNATKIIAGKPIRSRWKAWLFGSVVEDLVRKSGDIDIYVTTGEESEGRPVPPRFGHRRSGWGAYGEGLAVVLACTAVNWLMFPYLGVANLIMVYLLGVAIVAARFGRGPSVLASMMSVAAFDFFFIPPYLTFAVSDTQYVLTFAVMLTIALLISRLAVRLQQQAEASRRREQRTAVLYGMSRDLATRRKVADLASVALRHLREVLDSHVAVFLPDESGRPTLQRIEQVFFEFDPKEDGVVQWVYDHSQQAGLGTDTLPGSGALYWPLVGSQGPIGVLAIRPLQAGRLFDPEHLHLLETLANQIALAIERARLAKESHLAQVQAETERTRNAVLSTVSHDLRTPLAAITGAASSLLNSPAGMGSSQRDLIHAIYEEGHRLDRLVANLMSMTRLEADAVRLQKEWHPLDEVAGAALTRLEARLRRHRVRTHFPAQLPLVPLDGVLIQQVLINLLENAVKYAPPDSTIDLSATASDKEVLVEVADRGPGVPPGHEERIFDKFYRADPAREGGVGLGLTICRGIIAAHGGRIQAENRPGGGVIFRFTLPLEGTPPRIEPEKVEPQSSTS
ncbi:MAG TPA: DUF4118 domain-containing protein, partial [Nitrospiraceae bacterium]|nr:DUF4118 domain-containing protein [Nitrospiraceae bacterium]